MDKQIVDEKFDGGELKLDVKAGKLSLSVAYSSGGIVGSVGLSLDPDYFIDKLAEAIPGKLDDGLLALLKAALKS